jgi:hypothetical protein
MGNGAPDFRRPRALRLHVARAHPRECSGGLELGSESAGSEQALEFPLDGLSDQRTLRRGDRQSL